MRISDWSSDVCSSDLVNKITASADVGSKKFEANLNRTVKNLQQVMSQISTLEKSMYAGAGGVRQLNQAQQFGKSTEAAARFAGTVKNAGTAVEAVGARRSEEHTSELQSLMRISYAVFCLKKKNKDQHRRRRILHGKTNDRQYRPQRRSNN